MTRKQKRLTMIGAIGAVLMAAVLLIMFALRDEIVFFYSPTDILTESKARPGERFRLGGLVKEGSIEKSGETVRFVITDTEHEMPVTYVGILPDLFREGQGVIAEGSLSDAVFSADTVLAKHDENYMPKEVADTLKEKGVWQGEEAVQ
ncbi:MAG: cytochrome c maturation protein CcmE [Phyllobacteriaceae bacterium]|nr:cytochrome c maturation protein CcmE [Phyllobacteriaceae bacterium]